jgi:hypothetical protein
MRRHLLATVGICVAAAVVAASGRGDGGPGPGVVQGWNGVTRGALRYVAVATGSSTVVEEVQRHGGRVLGYALVPGNFGIPTVAYDGTTGGLSHDGRVLVLGAVGTSASLRKTSSFAVLGVAQLKLRHILRLRGDFVFDALSPGARMMYLVERLGLSPRATSYRVRAYDLGAGRLLPDVIIDKRSWESVMSGNPYSRAISRDGRWIYTLYGGGEHPFVHALDTQNAHAVCIDLPTSWNKLDVAGMRLHLKRGGRIVIRYGSGGIAFAVLDAKKLRVLHLVPA